MTIPTSRSARSLSKLVECFCFSKEFRLNFFPFPSMAMITVPEIFAKIIACIDQLQSAHSHEVRLIRNGTRHVYRRLQSIKIGAGGFLTAPCSPSMPVENGANVPPPRGCISPEDLRNWQRELHATIPHVSMCCLPLMGCETD